MKANDFFLAVEWLLFEGEQQKKPTKNHEAIPEIYCTNIIRNGIE